MEKRKYPAVFHPERKGAYSVEFSDLPGCLTCGEDIRDAYRMAQEALALWLYGEDAPAPSAPEDIHTQEGDAVLLVEEGPADSIIICTPSPSCAAEIRKGLKAKRCSMHRAAELLGVEFREISYLARGEWYPCPAFAERIGALLGLDPAALCEQ